MHQFESLWSAFFRVIDSFSRWWYLHSWLILCSCIISRSGRAEGRYPWQSFMRLIRIVISVLVSQSNKSESYLHRFLPKSLILVVFNNLIFLLLLRLLRCPYTINLIPLVQIGLSQCDSDLSSPLTPHWVSIIKRSDSVAPVYCSNSQRSRGARNETMW